MPKTLEERTQYKMRFVEELKVLPVAVHTAAANEQHYEVRAAAADGRGQAFPTDRRAARAS
jgi:hypothetical protein